MLLLFELQKSLITFDLKRHPRRLEASLDAIGCKARVKRSNNLVSTLADFLRNLLSRAWGDGLAALPPAWTTEPPLLDHLEGADLRVYVVLLTVLANGDYDPLLVALNDEVVLALFAQGF